MIFIASAYSCSWLCMITLAHFCSLCVWLHANPCLPKLQLNCLQHTRNALSRAVVAAPRSSDPEHIPRSLHSIKARERIEYKAISTTHKLLQSSSRRYLRDLITVQPSRSTRSSALVTVFEQKSTLASKSQTALIRMLTSLVGHASSFSSCFMSIWYVLVYSVGSCQLLFYTNVRKIITQLFSIAFFIHVFQPSFSQSISLHGHLYLALAHILKFDHSLFDSHWRW